MQKNLDATQQPYPVIKKVKLGKCKQPGWKEKWLFNLAEYVAKNI